MNDQNFGRKCSKFMKKKGRIFIFRKLENLIHYLFTKCQFFLTHIPEKVLILRLSRVYLVFNTKYTRESLTLRISVNPRSFTMMSLFSWSRIAAQIRIWKLGQGRSVQRTSHSTMISSAENSRLNNTRSQRKQKNILFASTFTWGGEGQNKRTEEEFRHYYYQE